MNRRKKEKRFKQLLLRYHALVDKSFLVGINEEETSEKIRLGKRIDLHFKPFYDRVETLRVH